MKKFACVPRVKICCIASADEAGTAVAFGASALGLVAAMPSGPGPIADDLILQIARAVPPPVATLLLTCATSAAAIIAHHRRTRTGILQLVDWPARREKIAGVLQGLRQIAPAWAGKACWSRAGA